MTFPRVGIYASILRNGSPLKVGGVLQPDRVAKFVRWGDCVIDLSGMIENPDVAPALRAVNPAIRLHAYIVMKSYPWSGQFHHELYALISGMEGFLYNVNGSPWEPNINLARPDVVRELGKFIAKWLAGWDGAFLDVYPAGMPNATLSGVDWRRAGFATERAFQDAWEQGHVALPQAIRYHAQRPDLEIVGNAGPRSHADVNGWMRENFPYQNGGTWETNMVEYVTSAWTAPGVLREVYREPRASWICSAPVWTVDNRGITRYNPLHPENLRRHRYGLASACLGGAFHSFGRYESDPVWCVDRLNFWYPEYSHPQRGKGWLGLPLQDAEHVIHEHGKVVDLWERKFEHGYVVVNPSAQPHSIYFEERYQPIGGTAKTAFSVPAHDGLILEAV